MDSMYVLQIMRDHGRDIEAVVRYKLYDDLTTAHRHFNAYKKEKDVIWLRLMWGESMIDEWRRDHE